LFDDSTAVFVPYERSNRLSFFHAALPKTRAENDIQKMLKSMGVSYTHRNEDIIVPNRIEAERVKGMLQVPC